MRGELWTASGRDYAGKPRPVLVVQDDRFDATDSVTICPLTTNTTGAPLLRIPVQPNASNGLTTPSHIMIDKITTVPRSKIGQRIGKVSTTEMLQLERGLLVFLGMTG
uniref:Growth inhibitor PemK n=2 Tax=Mycobacteriaceae TaxID=1762 RepID=A0A1L1VAS8_9MYCO|nr:hypothetical protein [Mycobacterium sp. MOTT-90]